jgi:hypothetical protein
VEPIALSDTQDHCGSRLPSRRAQVRGHIAKLSDQLGVAELAGRWISGSAERDRAGVTGFARQGFSLHHRYIRFDTLDGFARCDAVVGRGAT